MTARVTVDGVQVASVLYDFINNEVLPGTGVDQDAFWTGAAAVITDLAPRNRDLLAVRDSLQQQIDEWHRSHPDFGFAEYKTFLTEIGYLVDPPADFQITTANVDAEITDMAGPQLVVPVLSARFVLNAANAR